MRTSAVIAASVAGHLLAWVVMPTPAPPPERIQPVEFAIVTVDEEERDLPEPVPLPPSTEARPSSAPPVGAIAARSLVPPPTDNAELPPDAAEGGETSTMTLQDHLNTLTVDPDEEARRRAAMLDPAAVARGSGVIDYSHGPSQRGPAASAPVREAGPSDEEVGRQHSEYLAGVANAPGSHVSQTRPELTQRPDGSYSYSGHAFAAVITPDGDVRFDDRPGVSSQGVSTTFTADITDMFMRAAGQDPNLAERMWFMRHTEQLRARLESEHRRREMNHAVRRLEVRLARVWSTESRSPRARRIRIFRIWDEIDEGQQGQSARRTIIRFIRENLPAGHEHAYPQSELRRLNAERASTAPFAPYG